MVKAELTSIEAGCDREQSLLVSYDSISGLLSFQLVDLRFNYSYRFPERIIPLAKRNPWKQARPTKCPTLVGNRNSSGND